MGGSIATSPTWYTERLNALLKLDVSASRFRAFDKSLYRVHALAVRNVVKLLVPGWGRIALRNRRPSPLASRERLSRVKHHTYPLLQKEGRRQKPHRQSPPERHTRSAHRNRQSLAILRHRAKYLTCRDLAGLDVEIPPPHHPRKHPEMGHYSQERRRPRNWVRVILSMAL